MIFTRAGFKYLKFAYLVLLAGIGVGAFIVGGSYLYWQAEKKNDQQSLRSSQDLRGRLMLAKRDRDDLLGSEDTYKALAQRGTFLAEQRFDLIEALAALKRRHQLVSLSYEVAPQRPLRLGAGGTYNGVSLFASRVKVKVRALHDADLVAFLDEFPRLRSSVGRRLRSLRQRRALLRETTTQRQRHRQSLRGLPSRMPRWKPSALSNGSPSNPRMVRVPHNPRRRPRPLRGRYDAHTGPTACCGRHYVVLFVIVQ
jgi:hypothetical protein